MGGFAASRPSPPIAVVAEELKRDVGGLQHPAELVELFPSELAEPAVIFRRSERDGRKQGAVRGEHADVVDRELERCSRIICAAEL